MNLGKSLFAQLMEFVPWASFARIVARYPGDARASTLPSTEHFRIMDFARLYTMHQAGAFFVTRAKSNFNARRVYSASVDKATGVVRDQTMALNGYKSAKDYPEHLRRVRFKDPLTGKTLIFLTNNTMLPAPVIAQLYKNRWQVEFGKIA